jgi:hypothetical protein
MCDYSLHNVASRPAKVGDELVTTKFANSITQGLAAVDVPNVAVCLRPGTELVFDNEVEYRHPFARLFPSLRFGKLRGKVAQFRQINLYNPQTHHDALEFADGKIVLLTQLCPGQRARVLQLPVEPNAAKESSRQKRPVLVS